MRKIPSISQEPQEEAKETVQDAAKQTVEVKVMQTLDDLLNEFEEDEVKAKKPT